MDSDRRCHGSRPAPAPAGQARGLAIRRSVLAGVLTCLALALAACATPQGSPQPSPTTLGSRADAIAWFVQNGFQGTESPLADGTPRWLGGGPSTSVGEVQGAGGEATEVSMSVPVTNDTAVFTGAFINHFAPGADDFLASVLTATSEGTNQDQKARVGAHIVRIQTADVGNGEYLLSITVTGG